MDIGNVNGITGPLKYLFLPPPLLMKSATLTFKNLARGIFPKIMMDMSNTFLIHLTLSGVRSGMTLCSEGGQFDHNIFYAI